MSAADDSGVHIGSVLDGRYRIDAILGSGGMGRVYRGEHTGIGKPVAIKVLHADLGRNSEAAQRFQREALASGRLDHANIVGVSDFGVIEDGPCYLVMEALEGESLGERLARDKRIAWPEAFAILRGVLAGLKHAHDRGVVHRDIKPDNIFLAQKDGELVIKILDFGIAKLAAGTADDPAATRAGLTVGTPAYLSPEQAVGGEITPACDLYSATIVLYEMISGRCPFEDKDPLAMLGAHVGRPPPALADVAPELALPPGLEELVQRGLAKLVADRIGNALDYLALMEQVSPAPLPAAVRLTSSQPVIALPLQYTPAAGTPVVLGTAPTSNLLTPLPMAAIGSGSASIPDIPIGEANTSHAMLSIHDETVSLRGPSPSASTPLATPRAGSRPAISDGREIPKKWLVVAAFFIVGMLILTIVIFASKQSGSNAAIVPTTGSAPPPIPPTPKKLPAVAPTPPPAPPVDAAPAADDDALDAPPKKKPPCRGRRC